MRQAVQAIGNMNGKDTGVGSAIKFRDVWKLLIDSTCTVYTGIIMW